MEMALLNLRRGIGAAVRLAREQSANGESKI